MRFLPYFGNKSQLSILNVIFVFSTPKLPKIMCFCFHNFSCVAQCYANKNTVFAKMLHREQKLSTNDAAADILYIKFQKCVQEEHLKPGQIYKSSESGLYWKGFHHG
jgi:hypothetical protein